MGEIFTDEVISNWENLSVEERTAYLNEYYAQAGQALGIDTKGVYVADLYEMYGYGTQGVIAEMAIWASTSDSWLILLS